MFPIDSRRWDHAHLCARVDEEANTLIAVGEGEHRGVTFLQGGGTGRRQCRAWSFPGEWSQGGMQLRAALPYLGGTSIPLAAVAVTALSGLTIGNQTPAGPPLCERGARVRLASCIWSEKTGSACTAEMAEGATVMSLSASSASLERLLSSADMSTMRTLVGSRWWKSSRSRNCPDPS